MRLAVAAPSSATDLPPPPAPCKPDRPPPPARSLGSHSMTIGAAGATAFLSVSGSLSSAPQSSREARLAETPARERSPAGRSKHTPIGQPSILLPDILTGMAAVRRGLVSVTDADGMTHVVEVHGASVYDVAATAVAQFKHEGWVDTLAPTTVLQVEVHVQPTIHHVPLKALER